MTRAITILCLTAALVAGGCGKNAYISENRATQEAKSRLIKGRQWFDQGCPKEAEALFKDAVRAARLTDNQPLLVQAQNNLGAVLIEKAQFQQAAQWLEKALILALSLPEQPEVSQILNNLGALAYQNGQADQAEDFWNQALEAARTWNKSPARPWFNLARLNLERQNYEQARFYLNQIKAQSLSEAEETLALELEGRLAFQDGRHQEARARLEQAAALNRKQALTKNLARNLSLLGKIALKQGDGTAATSYLDRAFFLWAGLGDYRQAEDIYQLLEENQQADGRLISLAPYQETLRHKEDSTLVAPFCP